MSPVRTGASCTLYSVPVAVTTRVSVAVVNRRSSIETVVDRSADSATRFAALGK